MIKSTFKLSLVAFPVLMLATIAYGQGQPLPIQGNSVSIDLAVSNEGTVRVFSTNDSQLHHYRNGYRILTSNPNTLIYDSNVRRDLELDDNQIKRLDSIQKEFRERLKAEMQNARTGGEFDSRKWNKTYLTLAKERKTALGAVLLPHQSKRLRQIANQIKMRNQGDVNALVGKAMAEELNIDKDQKKQLQKRAAELKAEMQKEIAKLKEKYREKLIEGLRPDQRRKLREMVGDKFEHQRFIRSGK